MDCREFLERYSDYDDSLIPSAEADRFRSHMSECTACARYDRVLRKGRMVARQLPRPEPSPDFIPRLQRRLLRERIRRPLSSRLPTGLAAATVLMVAASAVRLMAPASGPVAGGADGLRPAAVEGGVPDPGAGAEAVVDAAVPGVELARMGSFRLAMVPASSGGARTPRAWTATEVATADVASYSPLETGPPAYRRALPSAPITDSQRRGLD